MAIPPMYSLLPAQTPHRFQFELIDDLPDAAWVSEFNPVSSTIVPIRMRRKGESRRLQHFMAGPAKGTRLVSAGFKALLEDMDPGMHSFVPVALEIDPGVVQLGRVWLLKTGRVLNAMTEDSWHQLQPVVSEAGEVIGADVGDWPMLKMHRDVVGDIPFWREKLVFNKHFCSRAFLREITIRGLEPLGPQDGLIVFHDEEFDAY